MNKAHVEHAIGFIEYKELQSLKRNRFLADQVKQATGSRYQNIDTANQVPLLAHVAYATENAGCRDGGKLGILLKAIFYLNRKFTRREQDKGAASFRGAELSRV